jgi:hypothetical protein
VYQANEVRHALLVSQAHFATSLTKHVPACLPGLLCVHTPPQDGKLSMDELCVLVERMVKEREKSM